MPGVIDVANVTLLGGVYGANNVSIDDGAGTTTFCDAEAGGIDTNGDGCVYDPPANPDTLIIGGMNELLSPPIVPLVVPAGATFTVSFQVEILTT